jgi:hypothetical protein
MNVGSQLSKWAELNPDLEAGIRVAGDAAEGPRAFAEKRPAIWKGR